MFDAVKYGFAQDIPRVFRTVNVWCNEHGCLLLLLFCCFLFLYSQSQGCFGLQMSDAIEHGFVQHVLRGVLDCKCLMRWTWFFTACQWLEGCFGLQMCDAMNMGCCCFCVRAACPEGRFGPQCLMRCMCENGAHCNPVDGQCTCKEGWTGQLCDRGENLQLPSSPGKQSEYIYAHLFVGNPRLKLRLVRQLCCWQSKAETEVSSPVVLLAIQGWNSEVNSPAVLLAIQGWNSLRLIHQLCCWQSKAETLRLIHQLCCWVRWYIYLWPFLLTHTHKNTSYFVHR